MRAKIRRRERRRRVTLITVISVAVVLVILGVYAVETLYQQDPLIGKPVTSADYQMLYGIATSSSYGATNATLTGTVRAGSGSTYYQGAKPIVVYIGAEYCPYCAFTRWPLTVALMRFGNFTGLSYMQSSSTDVFASTDTFTYYGSTYTSQYILFQPYEVATRSQSQGLQSVPSNYSGVWSTYGGGVPFINVANKYIVPGTFYDPANLESGHGGNWTKDILSIGSGTQLSFQVMSSANLLTALICDATGGEPVSVCTNPSVTAYSSSVTSLAAYVSSASASLNAGSPSSSAMTWSNVQYRQTAPRTKTSA